MTPTGRRRGWADRRSDVRRPPAPCWAPTGDRLPRPPRRGCCPTAPGPGRAALPTDDDAACWTRRRRLTAASPRRGRAPGAGAGRASRPARPTHRPPLPARRRPAAGRAARGLADAGRRVAGRPGGAGYRLPPEHAVTLLARYRADPRAGPGWSGGRPAGRLGGRAASPSCSPPAARSSRRRQAGGDGRRDGGARCRPIWPRCSTARRRSWRRRSSTAWPGPLSAPPPPRARRPSCAGSTAAVARPCAAGLEPLADPRAALLAGDLAALARTRLRGPATTSPARTARAGSPRRGGRRP